MKKLLQKTNVRHGLRIVIALLIACLVNYFSYTKQMWLPFATLFVMLTVTGNALYGGLKRFLILVTLVAVGSIIFSSSQAMSVRIMDTIIGSVIGILANTLVFRDRADVIFRLTVIPILKAYSLYFIAIMHLLLERDQHDAEKNKILVEKTLQSLPRWVFEKGYDVALEKGHRYFARKIGEVCEILFALHHLARYSYDKDLIDVVRQPLKRCIIKVDNFFSAFIKVLELNPLDEGLEDFADELNNADENFRQTVNLSIELLDVSRDYVYLAEFIYDLKDLREILLKLAETL